MTTSDARRRMGELLDRWYASLAGPPVHPGVPSEMILPGDDGAEGWHAWRLLPSDITDGELAELNAKLPACLPAPYAALVSSRFYLALDFGEHYSLPGVTCRGRLRDVEHELLQDRVWPAGYMCFGTARGTADPLCFDFAGSSSDDWRVVLFNHDFVPHDAWSSRSTLASFAAVLAESSADFLERLFRGDPALFPPPVSATEGAK